MRGVFALVFVVTVVAVTQAWSEIGSHGDKWETVASMPVGRSDMSATLVDDDVFVVGGCVSDQVCPTKGPNYGMCYCESVSASVSVFNTKTKEWDTSFPNAPRERFRHTAQAHNNKLYLFGGRTVNDALVMEVDVLDIESKAWSTLAAPIPRPASDLCSMQLDGKFLLVGGYTNEYYALDTTLTFDPADEDWSTTAVSVMNNRRGDLGCAVLNGIGYAVGGFQELNFCKPLLSMEAYTPDNNEWNEVTPLNTRRADKAIVTFKGGLWVMGGETKDFYVNCSHISVPIQSVELFDPVTDNWDSEPAVPDVQMRAAAAGAGNHIYLFGGQGAYDTQTGKFPVLTSVEALHVPGPPISSSSPAWVARPAATMLVTALLVVLSSVAW